MAETLKLGEVAAGELVRAGGESECTIVMNDDECIIIIINYHCEQ